MSKKSTAGGGKKPSAKKPVGFGAAPSVSKFKRATICTGEDLPALKRIAKELKGQNILLEDYILLVGPHTGDKGAALTKVMNEDLTSFRRMVTKVYDTMTKDASDVMANTQIELGQLYAEKQRVLVDKMIRSLQTIKDYVPDFDFQQYFQDPDKYLSSLFKLADIPDDEEIEAARRQLAYHRLQWLQSEGERLQAENMKLEERLGELKKIKRKQITEALAKEQEAERKRAELEQKQEEMQNELEELCDELHEAIITEETKTMDTKKEKKVKILAKKPKAVSVKKTQSKKEDWNVQVATEYSKAQVQGETANRAAVACDSAVSGISGRSGLSSRSGVSTRSGLPGPSARSGLPGPSARSGLPGPSTRSGLPGPSARSGPPRRSTPSKASELSGAPCARRAATASKTSVKKRGKKPIPIHARPQWQDVNLDEFNVDGATNEEQVPVNIFSAASRASRSEACPPSCPSASTQRRVSPQVPRGRRSTGPRDTWGGF